MSVERSRGDKFPRAQIKRLRAPLTRGLLRGITPSRSPHASRAHVLHFLIKKARVCLCDARLLKSAGEQRQTRPPQNQKYKKNPPINPPEQSPLKQQLYLILLNPTAAPSPPLPSSSYPPHP